MSLHGHDACGDAAFEMPVCEPTVCPCVGQETEWNECACIDEGGACRNCHVPLVTICSECGEPATVAA